MKINDKKYSSINNDEFLNVKEACAFLKISESCLYKLTSSKSIRYYKPHNKLIYFLKSDLIEWLSSTEIKSNRQINNEVNKRG